MSTVQESVKPQQPAPAKSPKAVKKSTPKVAKTVSAQPAHPKFIDMIVDGLKKLNERSGSSRYALLKYITSTYNLDSKVANQHLKLALKNGVKNGALKQLKGIGSNGSFKLGDSSKKTSAEPKKKIVKKVADKPAAKKVVKKPAAKKADDKPKKNVKKIIKPKAPKPVVASGEAPVVAEKPKAKPAVKKTVTKTDAKAKVAKKAPVAKSAPKKVVKKPVEKKHQSKKVAKLTKYFF